MPRAVDTGGASFGSNFCKPARGSDHLIPPAPISGDVIARLKAGLRGIRSPFQRRRPPSPRRCSLGRRRLDAGDPPTHVGIDGKKHAAHEKPAVRERGNRYETSEKSDSFGMPTGRAARTNSRLTVGRGFGAPAEVDVMAILGGIMPLFSLCGGISIGAPPGRKGIPMRKRAFVLLALALALALGPLAIPARARTQSLRQDDFSFTAQQGGQGAPVSAAESQPQQIVTEYTLPSPTFTRRRTTSARFIFVPTHRLRLRRDRVLADPAAEARAEIRDWAEKLSSNRFVQVMVFAPLLILTMDVLPAGGHLRELDLPEYGLSVAGMGLVDVGLDQRANSSA